MAKQSRRDNNTGSIYREGSGYRVAVLIGIHPSTGKTIYKKARAGNHKDAVETLQRLQADVRAGKLVQTQGVTFANFINHWLENKIKPMRAHSTYRQYEWVAREHLIPVLGKKKIDQIKRVDIQTLISSKVGQKAKPKGKNPTEPSTKSLSRSTLRACRVVLHAAFEDALKDGLLGHNPAHSIDLPREAKQEVSYFSPEQAISLLKAAKESEIPELLLFLLSTGARIGEALGLRWADVNFQLNQVRICGQLQRVNGTLTRLTATKTNQDRTLPVPHSVIKSFQNLRSSQMVNRWSDPDGLVFLNAYGRRFDQKFVWKRLMATCDAAGIPRMSAHKLRHTAATLALAASGDLHKVQKLLGHQQVALTANLYGHATAENLRGVSDILEKLLNPGS
jgi:integrase